MLLDRYAEHSNYLLNDRERIRVYIGDGRAVLVALPTDYQHVVVDERGRMEQAAPRFLSHHDRMYTIEALTSYLARLREDGSLIMRVHVSGMPAVMASAATALGGSREEARKKLIACSQKSRGVVLVLKRAPSPNMLQSSRSAARSRACSWITPSTHCAKASGKRRKPKRRMPPGSRSTTPRARQPTTSRSW